MPDYQVQIQLPGDEFLDVVDVFDVPNTAIAIYVAGGMADEGDQTPKSVIVVPRRGREQSAAAEAE